jgi:hypothetical protein
VWGAWFISTPPPSPSHVPPAGGPVVARWTVERVDDRDAHELAEPTARDQPARGGDDRPKALLEADSEQPAGPVCGVDHHVGVAHLHGERLLDEDVRARFERLSRKSRMGRMRCADDDDVRLQCEQLSMVGE